MKLAEALKWLSDHRTDQLMITTASTSSREWYRETSDLDTTFYLQASMGIASMVALGLAMALPSATVWTLMGDGGLTMNPSALASEAEYLPPNMRHIVVMNGMFSGTGKLPLANGGRIDFAEIARGFGVPEDRCFTLATLDEMDKHTEIFENGFGYAFVVLIIEPVVGAPPPQPPLDGPEMKYRFVRTIENKFGVVVFDKQGV